MIRKDVYEVAVIGGGVAGSAVAYFLSRHTNSVVLIEGKTVGGEGATSTSGGILRSYDNDLRLRDITYKGCNYFANWEGLGLPGPSPVVPSGTAYLFRGNREPMLAGFIEEFNLHKQLTVEKAMKHTGLKNLVQAAPDDIVLDDRLGGYASPRATATQLTYGAVARGCTLLENARVESLDRNRDLFKIRLSHGSIYAESVVLCLGSFFGSLLKRSELRVRSIPLLHIHSQEFEIRHPILDDRNSTYLRPIDRCNFYCGSQSTQFASEPEGIAWDEEAIVQDALARLDRVLSPDLKRTHLGWVKGFDSYTPSQTPLAGPVEAYPGLHVAMGFSGLGFKYSLSLGESLAARILRGNRDIGVATEFAADLTPFLPGSGSILLRE